MRALDLGTPANGRHDPHHGRGVPATAARPQLVPNVGAPPVVTGDRAVAVPVGKFEPGVEVNLSLLDDPEAVAKVVALLGPLPEWTLGMAQLACGGHEAPKRGSQAVRSGGSAIRGLGRLRSDSSGRTDTSASDGCSPDKGHSRWVAGRRVCGGSRVLQRRLRCDAADRPTLRSLPGCYERTRHGGPAISFTASSAGSDPWCQWDVTVTMTPR